MSLSVCAAAVVLTAAPLSPETEELRKLAGNWSVVSMLQDGESRIPDDELKRMSLRVVGASRKVYVGDRLVSAATIKVAPLTGPKGIDVRVSAGPLAGKTVRGIYKLEKDRLTICLGVEGNRPKAFESKPGSNTLLQVFLKKADKSKI